MEHRLHLYLREPDHPIPAEPLPLPRRRGLGRHGGGPRSLTKDACHLELRMEGL